MTILETILARMSFFGLLQVTAPRKTTENQVLGISVVQLLQCAKMVVILETILDKGLVLAVYRSGPFRKQLKNLVLGTFGSLLCQIDDHCRNNFGQKVLFWVTRSQGPAETCWKTKFGVLLKSLMPNDGNSRNNLGQTVLFWLTRDQGPAQNNWKPCFEYFGSLLCQNHNNSLNQTFSVVWKHAQ